MSDHWEFFSCQMGENLAFIFYDHGISKTIDSFNQDQQIRFDLEYKSPSDNGLPTQEEFEMVKTIEDKIEKFALDYNGIYVGRVTTAGHRYFYSFIGASVEEITSFIDVVSNLSGYILVSRIKNDPEKSGYWSDLYPTADDWQMVQDSKVVEALQNSGDINEIVRRIDHWVFFKSKKETLTFVAWLKDENYKIVSTKRSKAFSGNWTVQFYREASPELYTINRITYELRQKVAEAGGDYDGWETSVEKGDS